MATTKALSATPWMRVGSIVAAILFGALLIYGAGIANSATLHNAAHDSRHALGFPCH